MKNKNRIEVGLHFAPEDMRWKLAQEMAGGTINWRGIIRSDHMSEEGFQFLDQAWEQWRQFLAGVDIGAQMAIKGVDMDSYEVEATSSFLKSILEALKKAGYYTPDENCN